jgi:hypothetical protein
VEQWVYRVSWPAHTLFIHYAKRADVRRWLRVSSRTHCRPHIMQSMCVCTLRRFTCVPTYKYTVRRVCSYCMNYWRNCRKALLKVGGGYELALCARLTHWSAAEHGARLLTVLINAMQGVKW